MRVSLSFEVHQPYRINRNFKPEYAQNKEELMDVLFNNSWNEDMFKKVAEKCYYPATRIMMEKLDEYPQFKASFSFSGIFVEQCEKWDTDLLDLFAQLVEKKNVEILGQTYYHSLAGLLRINRSLETRLRCTATSCRKYSIPGPRSLRIRSSSIMTASPAP